MSDNHDNTITLPPCNSSPPYLHSFPTRRSSDLREQTGALDAVVEYHQMSFNLLGRGEASRVQTGVVSANFFDRSEEQRLNSSHRCISYAVFCLKKKKIRNYADIYHSSSSIFCIR